MRQPLRVLLTRTSKYIVRFTLAFMLSLGFFTEGVAQQLSLYAQHPEFHGTINPASLNIDYLTDGRNISFGTSFRQQWVKLGNLSPSTQVLRGEYIAPDDQPPFIFGGYITRDKVGITNNLGFYGRAAYVLKTAGESLEDGGISIGLNLGVGNWRLHTERLSLNDPTDPDVLNKPTSWYPDLGFGAYWYINLGAKSHYLYVGLSSPRTFEFRGSDVDAKRIPHYYGLLGYYVPLPTSDNGFIEVSTWSRYVENVPLQSSFHFKVQPQDNFWLGIGTVTDFKSKPMMLFEAGVNLPSEYNTMKIGYSYTWGTFLSHFGATHELTLAMAMSQR